MVKVLWLCKIATLHRTVTKANIYYIFMKTLTVERINLFVIYLIAIATT